MDIMFTGDNELLESLQTGLHSSPEEFLIRLEELLESGDITIDEAINYLNDWSN